MSAKRMLPIARAAGYQGSARNFRRLVAEQKVLWRDANRHQRRPAGMRVPAVLRAYLGGRAEIRAPRGAELAPDGIDAAELNVVSAGGMPQNPAHHELQHRVLLAALLRRGTGPDIHLLKSR